MPYADPERYREYQRAYRLAHLDEARARGRAHREANKESISERDRAYRAANRERIVEQRRAYRLANQERIRESKRVHRAANLERERERGREYHAANPARGLERYRAWVAANSERRREISRDYAAARRSRISQADAVEKIDRDYIYERDNGRCQIGYADICLGKVPKDGWHLDHVVPVTPLNPGDPVGDHTHANTQVACPPCNSRKGNRPTTTQLRLVG